MEEKERYVYHEVSNEVETYECYWDNQECCELFDDKAVLNRLNEQDYELKKLNQENIKVIKENQQLKQQLGEKEKTIQDLIKSQEFLERSCSYQMLLDTQKENILLKQQLKQAQNKKAIEELEGLQVQCQFSITFADYTQEQRLYDYINDRIKELKGEKE